MSRLDPNNVVVYVRESSDAVVRIGVSRWSDLREVIERVDGDDARRFQDLEAQVTKAMKAGITSS